MAPSDKRTYTEEEFEDELEKRLIAKQVEDLSARMTRGEINNAEVFSEIKASLKNLEKTANSNVSQLHSCRDELRYEIDNEFVRKIVFETEIHRMEAIIQGQWKNITVAVSVAVLIIQFVFQFWSK